MGLAPDASADGPVTPETRSLLGVDFQQDRYLTAMRQACERHGRLWTSLVRCPVCQSIQVCSMPAVWGFSKAKCFACGVMGMAEIPGLEFHSQKVLDQRVI